MMRMILNLMYPQQTLRKGWATWMGSLINSGKDGSQNICWNYETAIVITQETQMQGRYQLEMWFLFMTNNLDVYGDWLGWLRLPGRDGKIWGALLKVASAIQPAVLRHPVQYYRTVWRLMPRRNLLKTSRFHKGLTYLRKAPIQLRILPDQRGLLL